MPSPHVFWLFGLSGAGKTTLANQLFHELQLSGVGVLRLDGDRLRSGLCSGLGFSDTDRSENIRRAAETARLAVESNLCVVASFITPLEASRAIATRVIGGDRLSLIHLDGSLEVCRKRDVKGLYARSTLEGIPNMTGLSSLFQVPAHCALTLDTTHASVSESQRSLREFAASRMRITMMDPAVFPARDECRSSLLVPVNA
ncbi:MAG: adenylyl-sulfate kinase [Opitutus sp.]